MGKLAMAVVMMALMTLHTTTLEDTHDQADHRRQRILRRATEWAATEWAAAEWAAAEWAAAERAALLATKLTHRVTQQRVTRILHLRAKSQAHAHPQASRESGVLAPAEVALEGTERLGTELVAEHRILAEERVLAKGLGETAHRVLHLAGHGAHHEAHSEELLGRVHLLLLLVAAATAAAGLPPCAECDRQSEGDSRGRVAVLGVLVVCCFCAYAAHADFLQCKVIWSYSTALTRTWKGQESKRNISIL